jgi:hypothetical protein
MAGAAIDRIDCALVLRGMRDADDGGDENRTGEQHDEQSCKQIRPILAHS